MRYLCVISWAIFTWFTYYYSESTGMDSEAFSGQNQNINLSKKIIDILSVETFFKGPYKKEIKFALFIKELSIT